VDRGACDRRSIRARCRSGHRRRGVVERRAFCGPDDYGLFVLGAITLYFQRIAAPARITRSSPWIAGSLGASYGLSLFAHLAAIVLILLAQSEAPPATGELSTDLVQRFLVVPPPDLAEPELDMSGAISLEREEASSRRADGDEGQVGREDAPRRQTEIVGPRVQPSSRAPASSALGAMQGGAIAEALAGPNIGAILAGTDASRTIFGNGHGGLGLAGIGPGGGGEGPGAIGGAGPINTRVGGPGRGIGDGVGPARPRREITVHVSQQPRVPASYPAEAVLRVVRRNQAAVRYCYESELQRAPSLDGRIEVSWSIGIDGRVTSARIASSSMHNARVEGCIVRQVRQWHFDPPPNEVRVEFPFVFTVR
jgi:TonB family protein